MNMDTNSICQQQFAFTNIYYHYSHNYLLTCFYLVFILVVRLLCLPCLCHVHRVYYAWVGKQFAHRRWDSG